MTITEQSRSAANNKRVAVVGGGISGLAAAHRLTELNPQTEVILLEASSRLGGVLKTVSKEGFLVEQSADNFITNLPGGIKLCQRVGLAEEMLNTRDEFRRAFIIHKKKLQIIPEGFLIMAPSKVMPIIKTPILSTRGKLRMLWEYFVPKKKEAGDESLQSFSLRRFGQETFDRLIQPLVGGIYTADPQKLSLQATLPRFLQMEQDYGSLVRGALKQAKARKQTDSTSSGARYSLFTTPQNGMSRLVNSVAAKLPQEGIMLNSPVETVSQIENNRWEIHVAGDSPRTLEVDGVIIASRAYHAAKMLASVNDELVKKLNSIPYAGCAIVSLGFKREQIAHPLNGFGFVVPAVEKLSMLSASFSSIKYEGRAPDGSVLIRAFLGGAMQAELVAKEGEELLHIVKQELSQLLGITGEPMMHHVNRHVAAMPQYHLGHVELVDEIEQLLTTHPGLQLAGNAYRGVGVPQCIASGEQAAEQLFTE